MSAHFKWFSTDTSAMTHTDTHSLRLLQQSPIHIFTDAFTQFPSCPVLPLVPLLFVVLGGLGKPAELISQFTLQPGGVLQSCTALNPCLAASSQPFITLAHGALVLGQPPPSFPIWCVLHNAPVRGFALGRQEHYLSLAESNLRTDKSGGSGDDVRGGGDAHAAAPFVPTPPRRAVGWGGPSPAPSPPLVLEMQARLRPGIPDCPWTSVCVCGRVLWTHAGVSGLAGPQEAGHLGSSSPGHWSVLGGCGCGSWEIGWRVSQSPGPAAGRVEGSREWRFPWLPAGGDGGNGSGHFQVHESENAPGWMIGSDSRV